MKHCKNDHNYFVDKTFISLILFIQTNYSMQLFWVVQRFFSCEWIFELLMNQSILMFDFIKILKNLLLTPLCNAMICSTCQFWDYVGKLFLIEEFMFLDDNIPKNFPFLLGLSELNNFNKLIWQQKSNEPH